MRKVIVISGIVVLVAVIAFLVINYFPGKTDQPVFKHFQRSRTRRSELFRRNVR